MKSLNIGRIFFLTALVIVVTACPPADSSGAYSSTKSKEDSVPGPRFKNLGINIAKKKIIVFFNTDIPGPPDASKISVKKGSNTLKPATDYTLDIEKGNLVITLTVAPTSGAQYTVELQGGAVKNAKGKDSTANTSSENKTLTVGSIPTIMDSLAFKANSNTVLTLAFNTNIEIVDKAKIKVEVQADGKGEFTAASATSMVDTTIATLLNLTLANAATHNNVYRVTVGAGALRSTASKLANATELSSSQTTYSTRPILNPDPYILGNKLVATFNLSIALKNQTMVKVYKNLAPGTDGDVVNFSTIAVNDDNKRLLEITLPKAVAKDEVYRLRLDAGAVNEEGKAANMNKAIAPDDITIGAAPALDTETAPYLFGQKIVVTFDAPIRILDKTKIKYQLDGTLTTLDNDPTVVNTNQLEIPLNDPMVDGQVYRIELESGALGGGKNTVSMGTIQPEDKDITVWLPGFTNVQPVVDSATQLSVTFPVAVAIVDAGSTINVQKKDDKDDPETDIDESSFRTVSSRTIKMDDTDTKKIKIILTGGEKMTPYTQVWKVEFPPHTVETAPGQIPNSGSLTTVESEKSRLTDLYSWEEVPAKGSKWESRYYHTSVVFDPGDGEKIWVLGGLGTNKFNDVWSSPDGETWTESMPPKNAKKNNKNWWTARAAHTSVVFKDKIWVIGGAGGANNFNDVWSSTDGSTWTESTPLNDEDGNPVAKNNKNWWTARYDHTSVVFPLNGDEKKIWVIGGSGKADVWSSIDGSTWVEENANTGMGAGLIHKHASAVFGDKIWVIGGTYGISITSPGKFVWSSTKGRAWNKGNADLTIPVNSYPRAVEYKDRLWSLGGSSADTKVFLSSTSPATGWTAEDTLKSAISITQAVVFKNRIWLLGGRYDAKTTNKVWKMGPGPS